MKRKNILSVIFSNHEKHDLYLYKVENSDDCIIQIDTKDECLSFAFNKDDAQEIIDALIEVFQPKK